MGSHLHLDVRDNLKLFRHAFLTGPFDLELVSKNGCSIRGYARGGGVIQATPPGLAGGERLAQRRRARRARCALLGALLAASTSAALGDEPRSPWNDAEPRPFLSAGVDLGTSEHVAVAAGYGKPHARWAGLIAHGYLSLDYAAARVGAKVDLEALTLEVGVRWVRTFEHLPLPIRDRHTEIPGGDGFVSRVLDLSAKGGLPLGPGFAIYEVAAVRQLSSHGDVHLYDELYRIVYRPEWLGTASAGWLASLRGGALLLGGRALWAFETGRDGDPLVMLGPVIYWRLWPHIALAGELLYPVSSPDSLGFMDSAAAFAVLSFRAATGEPPPRFP
jgi:hypothetical protein